MCPDSLDLAQWIWTGIGSGARKVVYWSLNYRKQGIEAGEWGVVRLPQRSDRPLARDGRNEPCAGSPQ